MNVKVIEGKRNRVITKKTSVRVKAVAKRGKVMPKRVKTLSKNLQEMSKRVKAPKNCIITLANSLMPFKGKEIENLIARIYLNKTQKRPLMKQLSNRKMQSLLDD